MERCGLAAGTDHGGVGCEDQFCTIGDGLFENSLIVPTVRQIGLDGDFRTKLIFEILTPLIMGLNPCTEFRRRIIEKSNVQMVRAGDADDLGDDILSLFVGFRAEFNGRVIRLDQHVRPKSVETFGEFRKCQILDVGEGKDLQPGQKRFRRGDLVLPGPLLLQRVTEVTEPGGETAPLLIGPNMLRFKAECSLQFGIAAAVAEVDAIKTG